MDKRTLIINGINMFKTFNFYIDKVTKSPPAKRENRQTVPLKSGAYNMYESLGYSLYDDRELIYTGQLVEENSEQLDALLTKINNLLLTKNILTIQDTATPNYHYEMECMSVTPSDNERGYCDLSITFKGYPFKIWNDYILNAKWDDINFEIDMLQPTSYLIKKGMTIAINNTSPGMVTFEYETAADVKFTMDGITYAFTKGKHIFGAKLKPGINTMKITSVNDSATETATLSLNWKREEL